MMRKKRLKINNISRFNFIISLLILINFVECKTQKEYQIQSIYSVPRTNFTIIRVVEFNNQKYKQIAIISQSEANTEDLGESLKIDSVYTLKLKRLHTNPLDESFHNFRGNQVLYIDEVKVYDPNEYLFTSKCINGVYINPKCK
jgi:hypothetical protein